MGAAAIIAAALTDHSAHPKSLTIDGLDMLTPPSPGRSFMIPIETIQLDEEGPGGVSSLTFMIADPFTEMLLQEMATVYFWDNTNDRPLFTGWVQSFTTDPWATQGRNISVSCVGVESLLDWEAVPSLTVPSGTGFVAAIQQIVANATGTGWPIRAYADVSGVGATSTQALPIGWSYAGGMAYDVVLAGDTLRGAIAKVIAASPAIAQFRPPGDGESANVTIDFTSGLRVMPTYLVNDIVNVFAPSDYTDLTIEDTAAGVNAATMLNFGIDSGSVARQVYVNGATPAASGLFSDGSGIIGPVAVIDDSSIVTLLQASIAASDYLFQFATAVRGSFALAPTRSGFVASGNYRAGGRVTFNPDTQVVLAAMTFVIAAIHKSWGPGYESWQVDYGGFQPSAMKQIRRLTRGVRS